MNGFSPKLPLSYDNIDGFYTMNKTAIESIKQDLKMLVLTNPGERIMLPDYGVGIRRLLFSQNNDDLKQKIKADIIKQVKLYMNFVTIKNILIEQNGENSLHVAIDYYVEYLQTTNELILVL